MTNEIVKVVVPSYGLRGEFAKKYLNKDEFEKLKAEYIQEAFDLMKEMDDAGDTIMLAIFEKTVSPFQYWLENKLACNKINEQHAKDKPDAAKQKKADEFAKQIEE